MDTETIGYRKVSQYLKALFLSGFVWIGMPFGPLGFANSGSNGSLDKGRKISHLTDHKRKVHPRWSPSQNSRGSVANDPGDRGFEVQVVWMGAQPGEVLHAAGQGGCYNEAYRLLPRDESLELCSDLSSLETVLCFKNAIEWMPKQTALNLCKGRGSRMSVSCFQAATQLLPEGAAMMLCSQGGDRLAVECFSEASKTLSTGQAVRLCSGGSGALERLGCYSQATLRFGVESALDACDLQSS